MPADSVAHINELTDGLQTLGVGGVDRVKQIEQMRIALHDEVLKVSDCFIVQKLDIAELGFQAKFRVSGILHIVLHIVGLGPKVYHKG